MATFHIGADENGLGSRLGPMIVTAVLAEADEEGERFLSRKLPKRMREDLDDSKRLMTHTDVGIGEAWARALTGDSARSPAALFEQLSLEGTSRLQAPCPKAAHPMCWTVTREAFSAEAEQCARAKAHLLTFAKRGVRILEVRTSVVCTGQLNENRDRGINRFVSDLHAMERLVLKLRESAGAPVQAVCGKVGGIGEYAKFFGPLAGWLHATIVEGQAESAYQFPKLGRLRVRARRRRPRAPGHAGVLGRQIRARAVHEPDRRALPGGDEARPSGYHDPVTAKFVERTQLLRKKAKMPDRCFERERDPAAVKAGADAP